MTIKEFCKKYELTHEQFARIAGISTRTIRYINNGRKPSKKIESKIALAKTFVLTHTHGTKAYDKMQALSCPPIAVSAEKMKNVKLNLEPGSINRVYEPKAPIIVKKDFSLVWLYKVCFLIVLTYFLCYIFSN